MKKVTQKDPFDLTSLNPIQRILAVGHILSDQNASESLKVQVHQLLQDAMAYLKEASHDDIVAFSIFSMENFSIQPLQQQIVWDLLQVLGSYEAGFIGDAISDLEDLIKKYSP